MKLWKLRRTPSIGGDRCPPGIPGSEDDVFIISNYPFAQPSNDVVLFRHVCVDLGDFFNAILAGHVP